MRPHVCVDASHYRTNGKNKSRAALALYSPELGSHFEIIRNVTSDEAETRALAWGIQFVETHAECAPTEFLFLSDSLECVHRYEGSYDVLWIPRVMNTAANCIARAAMRSGNLPAKDIRKFFPIWDQEHLVDMNPEMFKHYGLRRDW